MKLEEERKIAEDPDYVPKKPLSPQHLPKKEKEDDKAKKRDRLDGAYADAWERAGNDWQVWQPARATGSNGPELRPEPDGSYRVVGPNPIYSTYVLEGEAGGRTRSAPRTVGRPATRCRSCAGRPRSMEQKRPV